MTIKRAMRGLHVGRRMDVLKHKLASVRGDLEGEVATVRQVRALAATIDASAGGTGETAEIGTIPAGSIILGLAIEVVTPFDGDTTRTVACLGVTLANAGASAGTIEGAGLCVPVDIDVPVEATWTNDASATEGEARVTVVYA